MELAKYLTPYQILLSVEVKDKWELIELMCKAILENPTCKAQMPDVRARIHPSVVKREKDMSTGVGNGYALPHARVEGFSGFSVCLATLKNQIDYETIDGLPVKTACMVIAPDDNPTIVLKILGALSNFMMDKTASHIFENETNPEKLYKYLEEKKINIDISIIARDIMRPSYPFAMTNTPLRQITTIMSRENIESLAIVDNNNNLKGEITCDLLFKKGIPDFFNQLPNISFIRHYDPFAKYFGEEAKSRASEVMSKDFASIDESATLMEIVYLLSVKKYSQIYVVQNGKLCGLIDRTTVLNQIINL